MKIEKNYIYVLYDPREPNNYRYVGFTNNIKRRFKAHFDEVKKYNKSKELKPYYKINWINSLLNIGLKPEIKIIEEFECDRKTIGYKEIYYGNKFLNEGHGLTNTADFGYGGSTHFREIYRYDLNDLSYFKKYNSIKDASDENFMNSSNILSCCNGILKKLGNYIWSYIILTNEELNRRINDIKPKNYHKIKIVYRYNIKFDENIYEKYNSVKEAEKETNINRVDISACCRNLIKTSGGFIWSYIILTNEELNKRISDIKPKNYHKCSTIIQLDKNNIYKEYSSIKNAFIETGISSSNISMCCRGITKTAGGFIWKYKEKK